MKLFYELPETIQLFIIVCAVFAGTMIGLVILVRYFKLDELFEDANASKATNERITLLEKKLEDKVKDSAILEAKNKETIQNLQRTLQETIDAHYTSETEKTKLQTIFNDTIATLNERIDELDKRVETQNASITELHTQLEERNGRIEEQSKAIAKLEDDKRKLEDTKTRMEMEREGYLAMAREIGLKIKES